MSQRSFIVLPYEYALCRLQPVDAIPSWVLSSSFYTVSKTTDELSVICESVLVPPGVKADKEWRLLKIDAVLDLSLTGITAKFSTALAGAGVNLCVIATYDTDYVMIKMEKLNTAVIALQEAGFTVKESTG